MRTIKIIIITLIVCAFSFGSSSRYTSRQIQFKDEYGEPVNLTTSASIYIYLAGTETQVNCFKTAEAITPSAQPITSTSTNTVLNYVNGTIKFWSRPGTIKLVVSNGTITRTFDNIDETMTEIYWPLTINDSDETDAAALAALSDHNAAYDHNDIATALQPDDIGVTVLAYDVNLANFPADPDADNKYLKWDDINGVPVWEDAGTGEGDMLMEDYDVDSDGYADPNETELEALLDLQDLQGAVTDSQVPNNITITESDPCYAALGMPMATYDAGSDGYVDGNDAEYDADEWDGDVNAPSKNAVRDKVETLYTGTLTPVDSNTITWEIDEVNGTITSHVDPNYVTDDSDAATTIMNAHLVAYDHNDIAGHKHLSFTILDPNNAYDSNAVVPICVKLPWTITVYSVTAACDKNPATELDWDLWFSADSTLASPTKVIALDTTAGVLSVNSGWNDNTIDVNSYFFTMFAVRPDANIADIAIDIEFSRASSAYSYKEVTVIEPNEAYDVNAIVPVLYASDAITIDQVIFSCDKNPTDEPNITLCFADTRISKANETIICEIDTTNGTVTVNSGWTDNTIPAGKWIYYKNNERPDDDLDNSTIQLRYSYD